MFKKILFSLLISKFYRIYLSTNFKYELLEFKEEGKYLCLAPHADDESIAMGGTLIKHGSKFDVICLTDGSKGGLKQGMTKEELVEIRKNEFFNAMNKARVNSAQYLEEIPDKRLILNLEALSKLDLSEYDIIFIPSIIDAHRDHKAVTVLLKELLRLKKTKKDLKIAFYEVWSALAMPTNYVDITDTADKKRELINLYQSQLIDFNYTEKTMGLNSYRGLIPKVDYAEAFCLVDIKKFLRISRLL